MTIKASLRVDNSACEVGCGFGPYDNDKNKIKNKKIPNQLEYQSRNKLLKYGKFDHLITYLDRKSVV